MPHNFTLIVTGRLASGTTSLLSVVQSEIETSIAAHGHARGPKPEGWRRPFLETASAIREPFPEVFREIVEFPTKDESVGEIQLGFRGPHPMAFLERTALSVLGTYLTSSSAAPLNKEYVDIEKPMWYVAWCSGAQAGAHRSGLTFVFLQFVKPRCSTYISLSTSCVCATCIDLMVYAGAIPTEHLESFDTKLRASLARIADEGLDMERMARLLARDVQQVPPSRPSIHPRIAR